MANIKSAKKRILVIEKKTLQNKIANTKMKTIIKKFYAAVESGDKAAARGIIHKNAAAHKKSQFTLALNKLA